MDRELICLIICFIVGIFLFYLLKQSCGCNVVEAHRTDCVIPSEIQSEMDWENICIKYIKCDNNKHKNTYKILNCDRYCKRFTIDLEVDSDDIPYIPDSVVELTLNNVLDPSILSSILSSLNNLKSLQIISPRTNLVDLQARPQEPAALDRVDQIREPIRLRERRQAHAYRVRARKVRRRGASPRRVRDCLDGAGVVEAVAARRVVEADLQCRVRRGAAHVGGPSPNARRRMISGQLELGARGQH